MLCTVCRPMPVPRPGALVVKNGSKMRALTSSVMPMPVSVTRITTYSTSGSAAVRSLWRGRHSFVVVTVSSPPAGMASRALTTRLMST